MLFWVHACPAYGEIWYRKHQRSAARKSGRPSERVVTRGDVCGARLLRTHEGGMRIRLGRSRDNRTLRDDKGFMSLGI